MKARILGTLTALVFLPGCLLTENVGYEESVGTPVTEPADFVVNDNNPPPSSGGDNTTPPPPDVDPDLIEEGFLINSGAMKTASSELELRMFTLRRAGMKISTDRDCQSGSWENWSEYATIPTPVENGVNMLSVQFRDWDFNLSRCFRQSIVHDSAGPNILFSRYPSASMEEGATADITAEVSDAASTVTSVTCSLNGLTRPCFAGLNEISITAMPEGDYVFTVSAEDDLGNSSTSSVNWSVVSSTRRLVQDIRVNNYKKVDILIVIDNSGSMEYEQRNMGQRTGNLLSVIRGLDFQIAVTTTDPRNVTLGDGRFIPISGSGGQTIIDSSMDEATAQARLSATLQRPETGSGEEQGIRSAYRVIERYNANDSKARAFFREGAQFAVLVISDEDESANTFRNDPQSLVDMVHSSFGGQKMFSFSSIITRPGDTACRSTNGYTYGRRYDAMSRLTGGVIGDVCAQDYASQVTGIAENIRDLLKTMTLQCEPVAGRPIVLKKDGVEVSLAYTVEGLNLKFTNELEPGDYSVDYQCLK